MEEGFEQRKWTDWRASWRSCGRRSPQAWDLHSEVLSPPFPGLRRAPPFSICAWHRGDLLRLKSRYGFQEGAGNVFRSLNVSVRILIHLAKSSLKPPVKTGTTCSSSNLEDSRKEDSTTTKDAVLVTEWIPENGRTGKSPALSSPRILSAPACLHATARSSQERN